MRSRARQFPLTSQPLLLRLVGCPRLSAQFLFLLLATYVAPTAGQSQTSDRSSSATYTTEDVPVCGRSLAPHNDVCRGRAYLSGIGAPKDLVRGAYWYRKAADLGDQNAQNEVGYLYLSGTGVEANEAEAAKWFARGMGGGSQEAKFNLALIYLKGPEELRNRTLGFDLMRQLAARSHGNAEYVLGALYRAGDGVPADPALAQQWFSRAAKHKSPQGECAIGELNFVTPGHEHNLPKAAKFLRRSAAQGYVPGMYMLGALLAEHPELQQRGRPEAVTMLTRAAEAGFWQASAKLAALARDGWQAPQDLRTAFRWLLIERTQGGRAAEESAGQDLAFCRHALSREQQDEEQQAVEAWLAQHAGSNVYVFSDGMTVSTHATWTAGKNGHN